MPTNFELKRLKPKLDIVEKPENRVHKLTDSNVSLNICARLCNAKSAFDLMSMQTRRAALGLSISMLFRVAKLYTAQPVSLAVLHCILIGSTATWTNFYAGAAAQAVKRLTVTHFSLSSVEALSRRARATGPVGEEETQGPARSRASGQVEGEVLL